MIKGRLIDDLFILFALLNKTKNILNANKKKHTHTISMHSVRIKDQNERQDRRKNTILERLNHDPRYVRRLTPGFDLSLGRLLPFFSASMVHLIKLQHLI